MDPPRHFPHEPAPEHPCERPISLADLANAFPDNDSARRWFEHMRWNDERRCPRCESTRTNRVPRERPMPYHCMDCRQYFNVLTGTVMQWSKVPLRQWAFGIYAMSNLFDGLSPSELRHMLGFNYRTTSTLIRTIRQGVHGSDLPTASELHSQASPLPPGTPPRPGADRLL